MQLEITEYDLKIHPSAIYPVCEAFGLGSYDGELDDEQREIALRVTSLQTWRKRNGHYRADLVDDCTIHRSVTFETAELLETFINDLGQYITKI